jgi:hypothetical protein
MYLQLPSCKPDTNDLLSQRPLDIEDFVFSIVAVQRDVASQRADIVRRNALCCQRNVHFWLPIVSGQFCSA